MANDPTVTQTPTSPTETQTTELHTSTTPTPANPAPTQEQTQQQQQTQQPAAPEFVPLTASDITFPEGMTVQDADRDSFLGILNNREMTPAQQAQALVDLQATVAQQASEAGSQAWTDMQDQWVNEVRNDPDVGGQRFDANIANIGKLIDEFGSDELRAVMDITGAGNNVHVVKFLANVASRLTEGSQISGGNPTMTEASVADLMYPSMKKGS